MTRSGIQPKHFDDAIRPQDDLYAHVNGGWLADFEMPPDRASDGAFRELYDTAERQVRDIINHLGQASDEPGSQHEARLVGAMYASFMNTDAIEAAGIDPIRPDVEAVLAAGSRDDLAQTIGRLQRSGLGGPLGLWVDQDPDDPTRYVVFLTQGGIGLPDEAYYREDQYAPVREKYLAHLAAMLTLAIPDRLPTTPEVAAQRVYDLEERLASAHWDVVKDRDETATHNPMTVSQLAERAPRFAWRRWADGLGAPAGSLDDLVVRQPSFFQALSRFWDEVDLADWQLWALARVVKGRAPYLTEAIVAQNFEFVGKVLSGTPELRERWKRGVSLVEGTLGEAVGQVYVARHFSPDHKARVAAIVDNLIAAYRDSIRALPWMSEATKVRALEKLARFTPKIGYPEVWRDYSTLELDPADLVGNIRAASAWETDRELAKIGRPVDRTEWFMTPQTVNAYYNPGMNEIVFPAAILQPPFFDAEADDAVNYGGIGAVIGHEIGHGFDDQGSKYDGDGRLVDWWTDADRTEFEARTSALIAQYDAFIPAGLEAASSPDGIDHHVNGALTIGENIGDLGGLAIAWKAYQIALGQSEPPVIDDLSAARRFFYGWAQSWRSATRPEEEIRRLATDPHSPAEWRCNGVVRNLAQFQTAFDVQPGDALWLDETERVAIW